MAIQVTFRGNTSDDYTTANGATEKSVYVKGLMRNRVPINDVDDMGDGTKRRRAASRDAFTCVCHPFAVGAATSANVFQDYGDLDTLQDLLTLNEYLWIYSVSGASRVDSSDADFWGNWSSMPVAVTLVGDPRAAQDFSGKNTFEFDLEARSAVFS